jgi:archaellum component FlaF (FlaF/FlaG flagellin family)
MNSKAMLPLSSRGPIPPRDQRAWLGMAVTASLALLGAVPALQAGETTRVSVNSAGDQGNGNSSAPSISVHGNGRYVAFYSGASNLVPGDGNGVDDCFVHDRQTGQTTRVSVNSAGAEGNGNSFVSSSSSSISANGRYVAFASLASNLVPGDENETADCFVHDRQTGQTTRVSVNSVGVEGNSISTFPLISANGRYVAFTSLASNLVPGDRNDDYDCFVHDRRTGLTTRMSVDSAGAEGNSISSAASLSATGRYVAFQSSASNLVPGDGNGAVDGFVHDRKTGLTTRVTVNSAGAEGNGHSYPNSISANGRYVTFASFASNLVPGDGNGQADVFVHDRQTGLTTRVSVDSAGGEGNGFSFASSISANGRYVAFSSEASNLVPGDGNGVFDCFVHDRQTALTTRVSVDSAGAEGNGDSFTSSISVNGRYVTFQSDASNLVPGDGNGATDCFVHDRSGQGGGATSAIVGTTPR